MSTISDFANARPALREAEAEATRQWWWSACAVFVVVTWAASLVIGFRSSLSILVMFGFGLLVLGAFYPSLGLLGVVILSLLDAPERVFLFESSGILRWNTFNYWLVLVMLLYIPFIARLRDRHSVILMWYVALLVIELTISTHLEDGIQHVLGISIVFGLLVYVVRAGYDRYMWFWVAVIAGLIGAGGGLAFYVERAQIPRINPNAWAAFPVTALFVICVGFHAATVMKRGQVALMTLAGVNFILVFLSGSRGNMLIGACCMLALLVGMRGVRQRTMAIGSIVIVSLVVIAHFGKLEATAVHRVMKLFGMEEPVEGVYTMSGRTSGRSDLALGGWYIFEEHPLGVGTGGFRIAWRDLDRHDDMGSYGRGEEKEAHSAWIKTLAENGFPGAILLAVYVFSFAVAGLRCRVPNLRRLGLLTSFALAVAFLSTEFQGKGLWLLAAAATAFLQQDAIALAVSGRQRTPARPPRRLRPSASSRLEDWG